MVIKMLQSTCKDRLCMIWHDRDESLICQWIKNVMFYVMMYQYHTMCDIVRHGLICYTLHVLWTG
jgi:hypothetical protein